MRYRSIIIGRRALTIVRRATSPETIRAVRDRRIRDLDDGI